MMSWQLYVCCLFFLLSLVWRTNADCVWYGIGQHDEDHPRYNNYTGAPKPLKNQKAYQLLTRVCPNYATTGPDSPLCCDEEQLNFFSRKAEPAHQLLRRCPACWTNFRLILCGLTCDPNQANYMSTSVIDDLVQSVVFNLTESVAHRFFNSCKDVQYLNQHALDPICGSTSCTVEELFQGLGGQQSPFPVKYTIYPDDTPSAFNESFFMCNASVPKRSGDPGGPACSCMDCQASCSAPPTPPEPTQIVKIFGLDAWWVGSFFVFAALILAFGSYEIARAVYVKRRSPVQHQNEADSPAYTTEPHQYRCLTRVQARLDQWLTKVFSASGQAVAKHPYITLLGCIMLTFVFCAGLARFQVTTNPVELWSGPSSRSRLEKDYFDQNFGPFYRIEQLIIRPVNQSNFLHPRVFQQTGEEEFGPALRKEFLELVLELQNELRDFSFYSDELRQNISLSDICFKPLSPDNKECAITSPLEYFQSDLHTLDEISLDPDFDEPDADYLDHIMFCASSPLSVTSTLPNASVGCLGTSGIPILPNVAFGGFNGTLYNASQVVVITFLVENDPDPSSERVRKAVEWEAQYLKRIANWTEIYGDVMKISYQAERSVEDEINRQSEADIRTVALSYIVMFAYVSIFLASYHSCRTIFIDMRITLGLGGVLIVLLSVVASVGLWSYAGIPATLIIVEVIPFLVLAVGVDNIFILVHDFEFDELDADKLLELEARRMHSANDSHVSDAVAPSKMSSTIRGLVEARVSRTLGRVGPSLLLTSATESVAFFCGSLTTMPAVRAFALYAGVAIIFNFLLQIFAFVALLTLDARRRAAKRFDVFCCFGLSDRPPTTTATHDMDDDLVGLQSGLDEREDEDGVAGTRDGNGLGSEVDSFSQSSNVWDDVMLTDANSSQTKMENESSATPWLYRLIAHYLTPFILSGWMRPVIVVLSLAWISFCIACIPNGLHLGLDQRLSMPTDSYMLDYFNALAEDTRVGPPLYFVLTEGHRYEDRIDQNQVCASSGCSTDSMLGRITEASKISNYSWIEQPASSWIDDYFDWIDPSGESNMCCRVYKGSKIFCPNTDPPQLCEPCPVKLEDMRPNADDFIHYLRYFLSQNPGVACPKGGKAAYKTAVNLINGTIIKATYYMTYHATLSQPDDFLNALKASRRLADEINQSWRTANNSHVGDSHILANNSVYPYSVFYVFYEQYLNLLNEAMLQIGVCLLAIILVTFLLLGLNFTATAMVFIGIIFILLSMLALMVLWGIDLNAISLVNLVVTVGIAVEFCAHIVRAFTMSVKPTRVERAKAALADMGSSILRGITLTKLGGIFVLAFSKSRLFQVFYFRMYLGIIVFGALTGLIVLPVILSYIGPGLNKALAQKRSERLRERDILEHLPDNFISTDF